MYELCQYNICYLKLTHVYIYIYTHMHACNITYVALVVFFVELYIRRLQKFDYKFLNYKN